MSHEAAAERARAQALEWRAWATGERKKPPHNLLAFTTDVLALAAALSAAQDALRRYGRHELFCAWQTGGDCTCGLSAALAPADTETRPCIDSACSLPYGHTGDHYDRRDGATWDNFS